MANEPGSLLRVLSVFGLHGINMSKLESRPGRERAWEYVFLVDLDADLCQGPSASVRRELESVTAWSRLLGCYAATDAP